ncbi:MAG: hypothetical protein LC650_00230 [Actinobacteria bacterium]|nr:hypothetical protein [Actinomycetota bacterium]
MNKFLEQPMVIAFEKNFPEVILSIMTVLYGLWITSPPDSLQFAEGYGVMTDILPSWAWGMMFLTAGLINLWGILRRHGDLVRSTSKVLSFLWFVTGFLFAWSVVFAPGWILMFGMAVLFAGVSQQYRTKTKWFDETDVLGPDM